MSDSRKVEALEVRARNAQSYYIEATINHYCLQARLAIALSEQSGIVVFSPAVVEQLKLALNCPQRSDEEILHIIQGMARASGHEELHLQLRPSRTHGVGAAIIAA